MTLPTPGGDGLMPAVQLYTEHQMFVLFLLGIGMGLLVAGLAVAALLIDRDITRAVTLPAPGAPLAEDPTERIDPLAVMDLRRVRTTQEWIA